MRRLPDWLFGLLVGLLATPLCGQLLPPPVVPSASPSSGIAEPDRVTVLDYYHALPVARNLKSVQQAIRTGRAAYHKSAARANDGSKYAFKLPGPTATLPARSPEGPSFDFSRTAPHLAFFCRLEINEAAGNVIPLRFRLGGHRYWQDDLRSRD